MAQSPVVSDDTWILVSERLPQPEQPVWYFFEVTGIDAGHYLGMECGLPSFGGARGFLTGDVTHWKPRHEGDAVPAVPTGWTYPERCLAHGALMPFDHHPTRSHGAIAEPPPAAVDWAQAAARGVFVCLQDQRELRLPLRELDEDISKLLVERVRQILLIASQAHNTNDQARGGPLA